MQRNDGGLLARQAVERALAECLPHYRRMGLYRLRDRDRADEVIQTFALRALERIDHLRDPEAVHGWLRRIFETTLIDHCRRHGVRLRREVAFELDLHDRAQDVDESERPGPEAARQVAVVLPHLRADYAEVIRQVDLLEQPRDQVAQHLGITVNNLTVRLHRARNSLRDQIRRVPTQWSSSTFAAVA